MHPLRFESLRPTVPHLPNFESQIITYVNGLISTIEAHGAAFFWSNKSQKKLWTFKNLCPKTCEKYEMYRNVQECITPSSYTCLTPYFFELYMYNSTFFELYMYNSIFFELHMYNSIFLSDTFRYISIHSTFSLFLNLPLGKRLHFSSFHG